MTTNLQQGTLLDVLKKKMRQTKEEMERYKDECEEFNRKHQLEAMRREEVSVLSPFSLTFERFFNEFQSRSGYFG
jgi:predicted RNase H-like nuclease (RuvC/YqgF family)